jgi:hypothetical protein
MVSSSPDMAPFFPQDAFSRAASALETTAAAIVSTATNVVPATPPRFASSQHSSQKPSPSSFPPSASKESLADLLSNIETERRKREVAETLAAQLRSELAAKLAHEEAINGPRAPPSLGSTLHHHPQPQSPQRHHILNKDQPTSRPTHSSPQRHQPQPQPPPPQSQYHSSRPQSPPKHRPSSPDARIASSEIAALKNEVQRLKAQLEAESSGATIMMQRREAAAKEKELKLESQLAAMNRQLSQAQAEVASSMSLAEERLSRLNSISQRLTAARSDAEAAELSLRTARTDFVSTEALLRKTEAELKASIEKNDIQRSQIDDLSAEILRLNLKNEETTTLRQREGSISVAATMASVADEKKMNSQDVKMLELEVEVSRLRASNSALHNSLREVDAHIERVSNALQQSEIKCSAAKKEAAEAQASKVRAVAELTARASFAEQDGLGMRNRYESALNQVAEAEARAAAFSDRIGGLEAELRASKQLILQLRSDLCSRSAECDAFGEQLRLQATENEALRNNLPSSTTSSSSSSTTTSTLMITETNESHNDLMNAQRIPPHSVVSFSDENSSSFLPSSSTPEPPTQDKNIHANMIIVGNVSPGSLAASIAAPPPHHKSLSTSPPIATALSATSIGSSSLPSSTAKTNHRRVFAALSSVLFAGPSFADKLMAAKRALEEHADRQVVIALVTTGSRSAGQFAGLYGVLDERESGLESALNSGTTDASAGSNLRLATRIFGTNNAGPSTILAKMVLALFKFDTSTKTFAEVGSQANQFITLSVDAIGIDVNWKDAKEVSKTK